MVTVKYKYRIYNQIESIENLNLEKSDYELKLSIPSIDDDVRELVPGKVVKYLIEVNKPPFCGMIYGGSPELERKGTGSIESKSSGIQDVLSAIKSAAEKYQN